MAFSQILAIGIFFVFFQVEKKKQIVNEFFVVLVLLTNLNNRSTVTRTIDDTP